MEVNELVLSTGIDIPFGQARLTIHQPTIKEIAYIGGDEIFFIGCELLNFSKESLSVEDKSNLINKSNFEVFMSIMNDKRTKSLTKNKICAKLVLSLLFPEYQMNITSNEIIFKKDEQEGSINEKNFEDFKDILVQMFCLKKGDSASDYNPKNDWAARIANKLKSGKQKVAELKNSEASKRISIFSRYISILAIGQYKTRQELIQYTVYQLYDEFDRFELKCQNDTYIQMKLAGAKDIKDVDNWMKDLHSNEEK